VTHQKRLNIGQCHEKYEKVKKKGEYLLENGRKKR
jgi:hypothetical protein